MYLVDTDWVVDYLKGKESVVETLQKLFDKGLYVSIISVAEIYEGIVDARNRGEVEKSFEDFLVGVIILNISNEVCRKFGEIRSRLRKRGELIGDFDMLIASTAVVHGLKIITNNVSYFIKIQEAELLNAH